MKPPTPTEIMTMVAARLLGDGSTCFVGIGIPSMAANLARSEPSRTSCLSPLATANSQERLTRSSLRQRSSPIGFKVAAWTLAFSAQRKSTSLLI